MHPEIITNNLSTLSIRDSIYEYMQSSKKVSIAVAFFNDTKTINELLQAGIEVTLIVSLRPPTSYYALKDILHKSKLRTHYLGKQFHSKIYVFYDADNVAIGAIVGSSNLTSGGLDTNIETNVILKDSSSLNQLTDLVDDLLDLSDKLQPDELNDYKSKYDDFVAKNPPDKNGKPVKIPKKSIKAFKISDTASEYYEFWTVADKVKEMVTDISKKEYPKIPEYLVIDHFWHWVVKVCSEDKLAVLRNSTDLTKSKHIPKLFKEYCLWDRSASGKTAPTYTESMPINSKKIQKLLSKRNINNLTKSDARKVFSSFHATQSLIQRFGADSLFISQNSISKIRNSLKYLLYSDDPVDIRIHNLIKNNSEYRLKQFGSSCVQELLGWANPTKMPIRNGKADKAIRMLGFR